MEDNDILGENFTNYIMNNFPNILPFFFNNFPFKPSKVGSLFDNQRFYLNLYKNVIKIFLNLNDFITKFNFKFKYWHLEKSDVVIVGYTGKIVTNPRGIPIGDYSNYFLKDFLNKKGIKTKEALIFNLKDLPRVINLLNMKKYLRTNNSDLLFSLKFKVHKGINVTLLKNNCTEYIKNKLSDCVRSNFKCPNVSKKELKKRISNLNEYIEFIVSNEFINYVFSLAYSIKYYLEKSSPKILIVNSLSGLSDRLCVYVAKFLGIKVIFLPHGIGENLSSGFINYFKLDPIPIDIYLNPTYYKRNRVVKFENFEVCNYGALIYGYTINDSSDKISSSKGNGKLTVLYATQPWLGDKLIEKKRYVGFLSKVFAILKQIDCNLIIKFHPRDNDKIYKAILKKLNIKNVVFSYKSPPFFIEDIKKSDVLLTQFSGIGYESILAGTPVISVMPHKLEKYYKPYESIAIPLFTENSLNELKQFLIQKHVRHSLSNLIKNEQKKVKPRILGDDSLNLFLDKIRSLLEE